MAGEEEIVSEEEMGLRLRKNILDVLELWVSKEAQLEYQENVPIAQVSAELFCQWSDFYYPEDTDDRFLKLAFNEKELKLLADFNEVIERESNREYFRLSPIELFVYSLEWQEINRKAIEVLKAIRNNEGKL